MEEIDWTYINVHIKERTNTECSKVNHLENKISYENKKHTFGTDSNYESFSSGLRRILKTSLITSFSEMAASKSCIKKVIKIIVFVLCLIGFMYQTLNLLWMYLNYPTVGKVYVTSPYEIVQPAVTVCNINRKRRSFVCSLEDNVCVHLTNEKFCKAYPRYCPNNDPQKAFPKVAFLNDLVEWEYDWERTYLESHNETMIDSCQMKLEEKQWPCNTNYMKVPIVDKKGDPNCCFAVESLVGQPEAENELYPNNFVGTDLLEDVSCWHLPAYDSLSDHKAIEFDIALNSNSPSNDGDSCIFNLKKANWKLFYDSSK
ncbi:uncharacterized protein TNIN_475001 [Trichonephila inaurata madagascariensis]|uniref:Uncharacterized protein n=1 Tax=Trichonephila inaurata madagascariensis TaxID=2747483 RepID=A0A8X6X9C5_9ARAC|nr:uncharacterized protein TNIN_475001 [Trichonephila inaurata madagascariensis]